MLLVFANMLNEMRLGKISDETVRAFKQLSREVVYNDNITTTELYVLLGHTLITTYIWTDSLRETRLTTRTTLR